MKHRTLSIDPGTIKIGITDMQLNDSKIEIISTHQIALKGKDKERRLWYLFETIDKLVQPVHNDIVTEATFVIPPEDSRNKKKEKRIAISSPLGLSMSRGVIYAVAGKHNKTVIEYDNKTHKHLITQDYTATKSQVIRAVKLKMNRDVEEDEAMSASLGFCHLVNIRKKFMKEKDGIVNNNE